MKKLTRSEIAKIFELNEVEQQFLDISGPSHFEIIEERERNFINKVLKPLIAKIEDKINNG